MQIFPAARLSRRVYRIVIYYRSMRVKWGEPSFSPAGCAELAVVRFVESKCVLSPETRLAYFSSCEAKQTSVSYRNLLS